MDAASRGGFDLVSRLLFPAPSSSYDVDSFPGDLIWLPRQTEPDLSSCGDSHAEVEGQAEGVLALLLLSPSARFFIYYLHSNGEDLGRCRQFLLHLRLQFQVHVLAVEYPGYGPCPSDRCDERLANSSALAGFRFLREQLRWPSDSILVMGRSIGCGPAIALASQHLLGGLVLVSPMLSFRELCRDFVGRLADHFEERFPNNERLPLSNAPLLVVHGAKDTIVSPRHGQELYKLSPSRKMLVTPPEMGHNMDLFTDVRVFTMPVLQFFSMPDYSFEDPVVPSWAFVLPWKGEGGRTETPAERPPEPVAAEEVPDAAEEASCRQGGCAASAVALVAAALGLCRRPAGGCRCDCCLRLSREGDTGAGHTDGAGDPAARLLSGLRGLRCAQPQPRPQCSPAAALVPVSVFSTSRPPADADTPAGGPGAEAESLKSPRSCDGSPVSAPMAPAATLMPPFVAPGRTASRAMLRTVTKGAVCGVVEPPCRERGVVGAPCRDEFEGL